MEIKRPLNLIVRGHIRSSFSDERLKVFLEELKELFDLRIYIQTWSVIQNSLSWRAMESVPTAVTEEYVRQYIGDMPIRNIRIIDDSKITHIGNTEGKIGRTPCPILGWKNMYYGMMSAAATVSASEDPRSISVQTRFDILSNPFSPPKQQILDFLSREYDVISSCSEPWERIRFLHMKCFLGVDNIYMSRAEDMNRFISYMYYEMDRILDLHRRTIYQEHIAFHERKSFFDWNPPADLVERFFGANEFP